MNYYCLSFNYRFEFCDDEVFFAYTIPYSYTLMQRHLLSLASLKEIKGNLLDLNDHFFG